MAHATGPGPTEMLCRSHLHTEREVGSSRV